VLFDGILKGGARAAARNCGAIAKGKLADLVALDAEAVDLVGRAGDAILDSWIFAGDDRMVTDVWSAGRHVVTGGRHIARDAIRDRYCSTITSLRDRI
jgi:formimidoylglutamate deiminase